MNKNTSTGDAILTIGGWGFFIYFIVPGIGAAIGGLFSMWVDGSIYISPWSVGVNAAAIITYLTVYRYLKDKSELRHAMIMLIVGLVLIPLQAGMIGYMSSMMDVKISDTPDPQNMSEALQNIGYGLIRYLGIFTGGLSMLTSIVAFVEEKNRRRKKNTNPFFSNNYKW